MKHYLLIMVALVFGAVWACHDSDPGSTACEEAALVQNDAMNQACIVNATCLVCECWAANLTLDGTECGAVIEPIVCDGTVLDQAEVCLADETVCASNITTMVETLCASPF